MNKRLIGAGAILAIIVIAAVIGYPMFQVQKTPSEQGKEKETPGQNYGLVTIKVVDQSNNELKANVSIAGKEGTAPFTVTLPYGVYKVIAKYKEFIEERTIKIDQAAQDVQIVITLPEKLKGVVIINPLKVKRGGQEMDLGIIDANFTILNERGEKIEELTALTPWAYLRYSIELEYGKYFYIANWNEEGKKSWERIPVKKNGTFTIEHPLQELSVIWEFGGRWSNGTVKVTVNVLTPPPLKIKEIPAETLIEKIQQVNKEEAKGIYNSETALWLYSLVGKKIIVTDGKVFFAARLKDNEYVVHIVADGGWIFASGEYSPEKSVSVGEVISFEGKVLRIYSPELKIWMTYDRLIAKK